MSPALVGRDAELAALVAAVTAPPSLMIIEGEAGIGKTRLLAELRQRPELTGRRFLTGWCRPVREPFPLGAVIEAVRALHQELPVAALSPVAGALRPLLPELAERLPPAPSPLGDRAAERHRVFRALLEVLTATGPTVLTVEDLHWADGQTVDFLGYLVAAAPPHLSLVGTFRGEEVDPSVRALAARPPAAVRRGELVLHLLDEAQTGELAAAILGVARVASRFARHLRARSSGLPLAIEELLALLRSRGGPVTPGGYAPRTLAELDVPAGIRDAVAARLARLPLAGRQVANAAAVLQHPVSEATLAATCDVPPAELLAGLEQTLACGLLMEDQQGLGFRHPLAAEAVYGTLPGPRRRHLHDRAAAALAALNPPPLGQLAHHLRHAGLLAQWAQVAQRAASQARALGHDTEAARLLEEVLRHAPLDPVGQGRLATQLAAAAIETVEITSELTELLNSVLKKALPPPVRGELALRLALLHEALGDDPHAVRRRYLAAVEDLAERPELAAWAMMGLAIPTASGVPLAEHQRWLRRMLRRLPAVTDLHFRIFLRGKAAMVQVLTGDPAWRASTARIEADAGGTPRHRHAVNAYQSVGMAASYAGHHRAADRLLAAALAGAEAVHSAKLSLRARSALALLDYCRGAWDTLDATVAELLAELADYPVGQVDVAVAAGCLALARGDLDQAAARLPTAMADAIGMGGWELAAFAMDALARLALAQGEPQAAVAPVGQLLNTMEEKGLWMPVVRMLASATRVWLDTGAADRAQHLVAQARQALAGLDAPVAPAALHHAEGHLLAVAGRRQEAAGHLLDAADWYREQDCRYEAAQAREQAAECLLSIGESKGEAVLGTAAGEYHRLGARWDADRLARTARRYRVPMPARHRGGRRGYGHRLSPRERQVALLAAAGRTNREIAQELFVSPKTVDKHVQAALRKLGLHSRVALAGRLGHPDDAAKDGASTP